jgi:aminopeptidase-like protein
MKLINGEQIYRLCKRLWPINRSISGNGVRETLNIIKEILPDLDIKEVPTGTKCFDWEVPKEWNINNAYIIDPNGKKIIDFQLNNLHLVGYSIPINKKISLEELQKHLHSLPEQPEAIPYVTSYYEERWGFCLSENQRKSLIDGDYHVFIDSTLVPGSLTYGEIIINGKSEKEIFLSTYICHPSMGNNELSGPTVTTYISNWLKSIDDLKYTYRIIFIPETIGSICYISKNITAMKQNIIAGYNISCVGDSNAYSYLPSKKSNTIADITALHVLKNIDSDFVKYSFLDRGSDERQYCSPGVDLPIASIMRTKYGEYKEYHTSLDNLDYISANGLFGAYEALTLCIECIEKNEIFQATNLCEPQLGKRGLYPTLSTLESHENVDRMMNLLAYSNGQDTLLEIAEKIKTPMWLLIPVVKTLLDHNLLKAIK